MAKLFKLNWLKPGPPLRTRPSRTVDSTAYVFRAPTVVGRQWSPLWPREETPSLNLLLTLLAQPAAAVPFIPVEWATRVTRPSRILEPTVNLFNSTLGPPPFVNPSWPAPPRMQGRVAEAVQNLLTSTLAAPQQAPLIAADWSRPVFVGNYARPQEQALNLLLSTLNYGTFPTTGILDHFDRADEDPLANGTWAARQSGLNSLRVVSNTMRANAISGDGNSYWTQFQSGPDCEWYGTVNGLPGNGFSINAYVRMQGMGGAFAGQTGYEVIFVGSASATNLQCIIRRRDGATTADLMPQQVVASTFAIGDGIGVSMIGSLLRVWYRSGLTGPWRTVAMVSDATYSAAGNLAADIIDNVGTPTIIVDDIGGGDPRLFPFVNILTEAVRRNAARQSSPDINLLFSTLAAPAGPSPFIPGEWRLYQGRTARVAEPTTNTLLSVLPLTAAPFVPDDWWRSAVVSVRVTEPQTNLLLTTLFAPAVASPFEPFDWSRPFTLSVRREDADLLNLSLSVPAVPFIPVEWMRAALKGRDARGADALQNYALKTLPQPRPFVSYDWIANVKTRLRHAPYPDPNLPLTTLYGLNPVGEPYWESDPAQRPFQFDAKIRTMKFPAKDRRFTLE